MFEYKTTQILWQKCPVYEGVGTMPHNFYTRSVASSSCSDVQGKTCQAKGIISLLETKKEGE